MKKFIIPAVLFIIAAIIAAYALYGGFKDVEITQKVSTTKWIAGKAYEGQVRSAEFSDLFQEAGFNVESGKLAGNLGGIYYNNPSETKEKIKAFVGVIIKNPDVSLPQGYELREVKGGRQILQARLQAHSSLIPGKVYPALFKYAEKHNLELEQEYYEEYFSMNDGIVQVPLKTGN